MREREAEMYQTKKIYNWKEVWNDGSDNYFTWGVTFSFDLLTEDNQIRSNQTEKKNQEPILSY